MKEQRMIKKTLQGIAGTFGYEVRRRQKLPALDASGMTSSLSENKGMIEVERLSARAAQIPGMVSLKAGEMLFSLCYTQSLSGDVVEVGSWQGRSTSYIAEAVKQSGNGSFVAIDHFKGNVGKESLYKVGEDDLSDLASGFQTNMDMCGLAGTVRLMNMPSAEAATSISDASLRFLFIDGDHSEAGVRADTGLFLSKVKPGGIVVFDDYSETFPGVVKVVNELCRETVFTRTFVLDHKAICVIKSA